MNKKLRLNYFIQVFILLIAASACKKHTPHEATVASHFTGNYRGYEGCLIAGQDTTGFTITATGDSSLLFSNLYNSGKSFTASCDSLNGTIPPQSFSGDSLLLGSFSISNDTLSVSLIVTAFSFRDNCNGVYIKR